MPAQASSDVERPGVVSLTKYIPYEGIPHAGGQYELQHYRALSPRFRIDSIAPSTPANRNALGRLPAFVESAALVPGRGPFRHGRLKLVGDVHAVARGSTLTAGVGWELVRERAWHSRIDQADVIELQWSETASLAPALRAAHPRIPMVVVAHDVITQRWRRSRDQAHGVPRRAAFAAAAATSARREAASFAAADLVIVFSDKDAELAQALSPRARVEVVLPGLGSGALQSRTRTGGGTRVLFTGAMNRPDNVHGAEWFIRTVWPSVLAELPESEFVIAGASPPSSLITLADATPNVRVTGAVDSLEPYYESADVFVAPLFTGAGVKFKTIDAMLRSLPVVTTAVGAEGLGGTGLYAAVTEDSDEFARGVVQALRAPRADVTDTARAWAEERFGFARFASHLTTLYDGLVDGR